MKRMHPINILENVSGYFWLLLFPLIRGFFSFRGGIWAWLGGVWFDLLILAAIFGLAFLRWWLAGYELTQDGVRIVNGILVRKDFLVARRLIEQTNKAAVFQNAFDLWGRTRVFHTLGCLVGDASPFFEPCTNRITIPFTMQSIRVFVHSSNTSN